MGQCTAQAPLTCKRWLPRTQVRGCLGAALAGVVQMEARVTLLHTHAHCSAMMTAVQ